EPARRPRRATATARGWTGACGYGWVGASESLLRASSGGLRVRVGAVSAGRFDALQVAPEEIRLAAMGVVDRSGGAAHGVLAAGEHEQVEVLAGADQGIDHLHGRDGIDVAVLLAEDQQQFA